MEFLISKKVYLTLLNITLLVETIYRVKRDIYEIGSLISIIKHSLYLLDTTSKTNECMHKKPNIVCIIVPKLIKALTTNHVWCAIRTTSFLPYRSRTNDLYMPPN
jgi:hypothetical protein